MNGSFPFPFPSNTQVLKKLSWSWMSKHTLYFISGYIMITCRFPWLIMIWGISSIFKAICLNINKFQVHDQEKGILVVFQLKYIQLHWKSILIFHKAYEIELVHTKLYVQWLVGIGHSPYFTTFFYTASEFRSCNHIKLNEYQALRKADCRYKGRIYSNPPSQ